jgi:hypothetical protein
MVALSSACRLFDLAGIDLVGVAVALTLPLQAEVQTSFQPLSRAASNSVLPGISTSMKTTGYFTVASFALTAAGASAAVSAQAAASAVVPL